MILRYGETYNEGYPDIKADGTVDVREILSYEVVSAYRTTMADLEEVLEVSMETENDGTLKHRFEGLRDSEGNLTDIRVCQGHSTYVQQFLTEGLYMTPAFWGDPFMTAHLLHGTRKRNVAGIRQNGLKAGGTHGDRAFIFLVPERPDSWDHPLLRHGTECVVKVDAG